MPSWLEGGISTLTANSNGKLLLNRNSDLKSDNCVQNSIKSEYLKRYNCELFILRIIT